MRFQPYLPDDPQETTGGGKRYVVLIPRIRLQRSEENLANMTSVQVIKLQVSKAVVQSAEAWLSP